ncbi:MAG TPA: glycosyltransferase family 4 protein [Steroidobacteraceae bacterium]|nr:glycosyltransferase family 4 protein [Steroidobacteraceae bacterium]
MFTEPMKIALVVPGGVDRSGEYRVVPALLALIRRLARVHDVHVFALSQEPAPGTWRLEGAYVHNIGARQTRLRAVRAILREHRARPFDVVHSIWSGASGTVAVTAAGLLRLPSLIHVAGVELIALPDIACGGRLRWRGRLREAMNLRGASMITAASSPMVQSVASLGCTAVRVPLGVDSDTWPPRPPHRRAGTGPARLIHVASLNAVKDQQTLLRAMAVLAAAGIDFRLDIVGEDTLGGKLQVLSQELGLASRVRFLGFQTRRQLRPLVESADLLVVSSRHEAGPMAVLEAAALGVPTVGTCVGHIAEWAPSAAVSVGIGDWNELAASVRRLVEDEELRLRVARQAWQRATAEDADYTASRFQALYGELVGAG